VSNAQIPVGEACSYGDICTLVAQHDRDLRILAKIGTLLASQSGQRQMLAAVLEELERQFGMTRSTIMLLSSDGNELFVGMARDIATERQDLRYRRGEGIIGNVFESGEAAIVPSILHEPRFTNRIHQRRQEEDDASFLCVPIRLGSEVVGTLSVDLPLEDHDTLAKRSRLMGIVASMIAYDVKARRTEALHQQRLESENLRLRSALEEKFRPENIIGNSKAMEGVYLQIHHVAAADTTVLVRGESGTGKELVASAIHYRSPRSHKPFVKVNCAALSEGLLESELFGHEKGAFTGALFQRIGRFEEAEGGTLFLDEIGDFSPTTQVKLLRALQEREFERVGSNKTVSANVRVIAATNQDLESRVEERLFRGDLYYRINVFPIFLPPLRDRKHDIILLADHFVAKYSRKMGKNIRRISTPAINMMMAYHWPGNVRELENCIEYAVLLSKEDVIHGSHLPPSLQLPEISETVKAGSLKMRMDLAARDVLMDALKATEGNISEAARQLGITPRMARYKIRKLGIDYQRFFKMPQE
jgi:Nif-specific regulatory protein